MDRNFDISKTLTKVNSYFYFKNFFLPRLNSFKKMKLLNIVSFLIIVLMNIITGVVAQNQNNILINDVETIFNIMQKKVQEYLQTFSTITDVSNIVELNNSY
jgi:hypothetical protein